jgi:hypothetical protein
MVYTDLEMKVIKNLHALLEETECIYLADLIGPDDDPKKMRGAIASLVKKNVIDVDYIYPSIINGTKHYPVDWNDSLISEVCGG